MHEGENLGEPEHVDEPAAELIAETTGESVETYEAPADAPMPHPDDLESVPEER